MTATPPPDRPSHERATPSDHEELPAPRRTSGGHAVASNAAGSLLAIALTVLVAIDLVSEIAGGMPAFHAALDGAAIAIGAVSAARLAMRVRTLTREARNLRDHADELSAHLATTRQDAARWRREAGDLLAGLSGAIDRQLERWALTPAEKAIALLLLKGLSHKQIAELRGVSETTVRQQSRAIYRKAGLSGRSDLAAFFLEDLLDPAEPRATSPPPVTAG